MYSKMHVPVDQDSTSYTECQEERDEKGSKERILFKPQVTVNVYNTGGPSTGGTTSDGLIADGSGASAISGNGPALGAGSEPTVSSLAAQLAALSEKVEQLSLAAATRRSTHIDSGSWNTSDVRSWEAPRAQTSGRVNFAGQFSEVPMVMVSMNCADVDNAANFRVRVYATDIDLDGFTIHADSWADTRIYSCGVSWTAIGK